MKWRTFIPVCLGVVAGIVASAGVIAVAVTSFSLSYDAITAVSVAAHVRKDIAWMMAVSVDGAMSVATVCAVVLQRLGRNPVYPWFVVVSGAAISVMCNAAHATGDLGKPLALSPEWRMAISAIPAVMLALSVHLLVILVQAFQELVATGLGDRSPAGLEPVSETGLPSVPETGLPSVPETGLPSVPETGSRPVPETGSRPVPETGSRPVPETGLPAVSETAAETAETAETGSRDRFPEPARRSSRRRKPASLEVVAERLNLAHIEEHGRPISADKLVSGVRAEGLKLGKTNALKMLADMNAAEAETKPMLRAVGANR